MDVQIDSLLIPVLLSIGLLASNAQAGLIGTVTPLCSAVGGWAAGVLADRYGRALMLLIFRGLMGSGFGGEWAVGAILIGERSGPSTAGGRLAPCRAAGPSAGASRSGCSC
jgi:MFS family permease